MLCGKPITQLPKGRRKRYCDIRCSREAWAISKGFKSFSQYGEALRKAKPLPIKVCEFCGQSYQKKLKRKYCSDDCAIKAASAKAKVQNLANYKTRPAKTYTCTECGKDFLSKGKRFAQGTIYCSFKCQRKADRRKRDYALRGEYAEHIDFATIVKRDRGRCKLCGERVALNEAVPHPKAATLDHIVPLARGGLHTATNVQLAHFQCNCVKWAKVPEEVQLAIV